MSFSAFEDSSMLILLQILWIPSLVGWGSLLRSGNDDSPLLVRLAERGLLGLVLLTVIGSVANLFVGLGGHIPPLALLLGYISLAWLGPVRRRREWLSFGLALSLVSLILERISFPYPAGWDAGFYHFPIVEWITRGPWPLGVARLHPWYATNSSLFVLDTVLWLPTLGIDGLFVGSCLFAALCALATYPSAKGALLSPSNASLSGLFALWFGIALGLDGYLIPSSLAIHSTDVPVVLLGGYCIFLLLRSGELPERRHDLAFCTVLAAFALTIKLTAFPLFLGALSLTVTGLLRERKGLSLSKTERRASVLLIIILTVWLVRGVFSSGCLVFPVFSTCFKSLSWSLSEEAGGWYASELAIMRIGNVLELYPLRLVIFLAGSVGLSSLFLARQYISGGRKGVSAGTVKWVFLLIVGGWAYCTYVTAYPRYAYPYSMMAVALSLALVCSTLRGWARRLLKPALGIVVVAVIALVTHRTIYWSNARESNSPKSKIPEVVAEKVGLPSGEAVFVPIGELYRSRWRGRCWLHPQPCTERVLPTLRFKTDVYGRVMFH